MKAFNNYIIEKLKLNKDTKIKYNFSPHNKDELQSLIEKLLEERGKDANLNDIDTSKINDMSGLFDSSHLHIIRNIDISEWNVSNVKNMTEMFGDCEDFNCDLSKWDVSNVEVMNYMFYNCTAFDCDLSSWDVSKVKRWNCFSYGSKNIKRPKFNWNNVK
jgi:surface protein